MELTVSTARHENFSQLEFFLLGVLPGKSEIDNLLICGVVCSGIRTAALCCSLVSQAGIWQARPVWGFPIF